MCLTDYRPRVHDVIRIANAESLPGKHLALLKRSSYLCSYKPSLPTYLETELYLLPCGSSRTRIDRHYRQSHDLHKNISSSER